MRKSIVCITLIILAFSPCMAKAPPAGSYYKDFVKFLEVSGATGAQKVMLRGMFKQFKKMPNINPEVFKNMEKIMIKELNVLNRRLLPVYKKHLSQKDLKEIIKFYESPVGKRMVKSQPLIMDESMQIGAAWGQDVVKRLMENKKPIKKTK